MLDWQTCLSEAKPHPLSFAFQQQAIAWWGLVPRQNRGHAEALNAPRSRLGKSGGTAARTAGLMPRINRVLLG